MNETNRNIPIPKPNEFILDLDQINNSEFYKKYIEKVAKNYIKYIHDTKLENND